MKLLLSLLLFLSVFAVKVVSQPMSETEEAIPDPKVAFLKSMAVPGWGHHYVDKSNWRRGKFHLGADAVLLLSYLGLRIHSNNVQQNWYSYGSTNAGVPIEGRSRRFQLAVGDFNSLRAYNDFQARNRNWNKLFKDRPANRWQWANDEARSQYSSLRNRFERIDRQLPALLGLMALNRVISGISAFNRAKKKADQLSQSMVYVTPYRYSQGIMANFQIRF
ncbi:hypothetical protein LX73_0142 [Fodinibius salinus]|uniref:DUF5683 domain-containing protein n=1 Tax=Fodinibius salinus TaxID=860790 RepID=A0A5D3YP94_9BACT|nr:hypothetical protein [Fodinibius salinus]TYP94853.1 hypothetical protein LX73_0142 [Fodinibius salinus]